MHSASCITSVYKHIIYIVLCVYVKVTIYIDPKDFYGKCDVAVGLVKYIATVE